MVSPNAHDTATAEPVPAEHGRTDGASAPRCPYPFARPSALEVPHEIAGLREQPTREVTLPSGDAALLVTRHRDVTALLTDHRLSRNLNRPGAARISTNNRMFQDSKMDPDPPEHTRVRRLVLRAFTSARVEALRPFVVETTDGLLDAMVARGPVADLTDDFAFPLTIAVLGRLLGVPTDEMDALRRWTDRFLSVSAYPGPEIGAAMREMSGYIADLIERKRADPGDDLVSDMIRAEDPDATDSAERGRLTSYELHWWCRLLLLVGYETTASQIVATVALLLSHPEQLAAVRADRTLLGPAIEEALRWKPVGSSVSMLRYATEDIPMDGYTIPAGTSVIPAADSANHDTDVFDDPHVFDVRRANPADHLTFSRGPHLCIGAALARTELDVAVGSLLDRFPDLALAVEPTALARQSGALLEGFQSVPVTW